MSHYIQHIGLTAWRRKTSLLAAACLLVLLVLGLQFSLVEQEKHSSPSFSLLASTGSARGERRRSFIERVANVKFFNTFRHSDNSAESARDENSKRKLSEETDKARRELSKQLGIPTVTLDAHRPYVPSRRIVHFDLKGAPLKVAYFKKIFPLIKTMGATGVLIEYEDMFPYDGILKDITAKNAYTVEQIEEILKLAEESKLEVIPLVQTFGHVEFALKHAVWSKLREVPESPQALCPNRNGTIEFIDEMVRQMLFRHPKINYIHIGCDEVFQMGECEVCRLELHENLFLKHVKAVATSIHKKYPHLRIIIWDDMLRHVSQQSMFDYGLGRLVEPMVWVYAEDIYRFVQSAVWDKYAAVFSTAWTASAFKGAFGPTLYVPDSRRHLENNLRWLEVMSLQGPTFKKGFAGIVLTGWQRYDHFAVLCELFPASIPSLALSLLAVTHGYFNLTSRTAFLSALSCPEYGSTSGRPAPFVALETDPHLWDKLGRCMFPGSPIFRLTYRLHNAEIEAKEYLKDTRYQKGWLTDYNVRHNYTLPLRVDELNSDLQRIYHSLLALVRACHETMVDVFDYYTISEWIEQRIYPYVMKLEKIQNDSQVLKSVISWPARPLKPLKDLQRLGVPQTDDEH